MLTGEIRNQVDRVWDAFCAGGISNPLETQREQQINTLGHSTQAPVFPASQSNLRWSRLKNMAPALLYETLASEVFPFIKTLGDSTFAAHMRDARFTLPPEKAAHPSGISGLFAPAEAQQLIKTIQALTRFTVGDI